MKSSNKINISLKNLIIYLSLIISVGAATPSSYNRNYASRPATQSLDRGSRYHYDGSNYHRNDFAPGFSQTRRTNRVHLLNNSPPQMGEAPDFLGETYGRSIPAARYDPVPRYEHRGPSRPNSNNLPENFKPFNKPVPTKRNDPSVNNASDNSPRYDSDGPPRLPDNFRPFNRPITPKINDSNANSPPSVNNLSDNFWPNNRSNLTNSNNISNRKNFQPQLNLNPQSLPKPNQTNHTTQRPASTTSGSSDEKISNNATIAAQKSGNKSSFNDTTKLSIPGKSDIIPVVLKESNLNATNRSNTNTTLPAQNGGNKSSANNTTKFSTPGNTDVSPVVLKQSNLNASNSSKAISPQTLNNLSPQSRNNSETSRNETKVNQTFHLLNPSNASSSEIGFDKFHSGSANDDKTMSSLIKKFIKELKKFGKKSYTMDYGRPVMNKGSNLKLFGGKVINSFTGCFISIAVIYAAF